jgi:hypothetical protein
VPISERKTQKSSGGQTESNSDDCAETQLKSPDLDKQENEIDHKVLSYPKIILALKMHY